TRQENHVLFYPNRLDSVFFKHCTSCPIQVFEPLKDLFRTALFGLKCTLTLNGGRALAWLASAARYIVTRSLLYSSLHRLRGVLNVSILTSSDLFPLLRAIDTC